MVVEREVPVTWQFQVLMQTGKWRTLGKAYAELDTMFEPSLRPAFWMYKEKL